MIVEYRYGAYDILRADDLNNLDCTIQEIKGEEEENVCFAIGIYDDKVCSELGISKPLKSLEDRMTIMEQIRGVDFVFPVTSRNTEKIQESIRKAYFEYLEKLKEEKENTKDPEEKKNEIGYAPGTYDLFHAGHLENLLIASEQSKKLVAGIKADRLVQEHKHKTPILSEDERVEILRHFKFVHDVYKYYTRDLYSANDWIKSKYGHGVDAVFLGSDLKEDFKDVKGINIVFTPRDPKKMAERSTTGYRKKLRLNITDLEEKEYFGKINPHDRVKSGDDSAKKTTENEIETPADEGWEIEN